MPPVTGRLNPGIEYQFKVITYAAVCLCENKDVKDFLIYTNKEEVPGFDDIIIKVWYKSQSKPFVYLGQIKHRTDKINLNNKASNIKKYRDDMKTIFVKKATNPFLKELFKNIPDENVEFWFFCSKLVLNTKNNNPIIIDEVQYDVKPNKAYKSIFSFTKSAGCYKLIADDTAKDSGDFHRFYLFLDQPDNMKINESILKCDEVTFTKETTSQIIAYTTGYLQTSLGSLGLKKYVFEIHLLRVCLSLVTIPPTEAFEMYDELARIWNKLHLEYDVTIVDQGTVDIKPYLFGTLFNVLKILFDDTAFNWNSCISNSNKLPEHFNYRKFMDLTKRDKIYYWLSKPDVLDVLLVELWKCDYIPLILSSDTNISILKKYQHLKKKFIVLDNDFKISNEIRSSGLKVCANMGHVKNDSAGRELLEGVHVSLQGREPVKFVDVVKYHKSILSEIRLSHMLNLLKKPNKIYVKKQCLEHTSSMVFIISHDPNSNEEVSDDWKSNIAVSLKSTIQEENVIIKCTSFEVEKHIRQVKNHPNLKNYSTYQLRRLYPNGRLEYSKGDILKIKHFLIDEVGNELHVKEGKLTPIIGARPWNEEDQYITRHLRKATIQNSFFNFEEGRIIFLKGDVNSLETHITEKIINEFSGDIEIQVEKCIKERRTAFVIVENESFDQYWSMFSSSQYPVFHVQVDNGKLTMLKYRNYQSLYPYVTYEGHEFKEENFFEQTTTGINIISGEAGSGKSALLHSLFERYHKHNFVLFCDLLDYLSELQEGRKSDLFKKPLKYILSRCEYTIPSNCLLPNGFFNSLCEFHHKTNRLLLMIDSFDQAVRVHKKEVLELVKDIANSNIRIIVACRPIAESLLINNFEVQSVQLKCLDKYSAARYLKNNKLTSTDINRIPVEFLKNPLYLKSQISLSKDIFLICHPGNKFNLYRAVIEKQIERYYQQRRDAYSSTYQREDILKVYKLLALALIFGKDVIEEQGLNYDQLVQECVSTHRIDLGIIVRFSNDGYPIFALRMFAEFLVVLWIYENINTTPAQKIYERLLDSEQRNMRHLLDNYVCENLKLHQAILREDIRLVQNLCEENKEYLQDVDECNRTPLHLAASYCRDGKDERELRVEIADKTMKYRVLDIIIRHMAEEKSDFSRRDLMMKWTWFDYIRGNKFIFEILCLNGLSATLEKYLDLEKRNIEESDIDNSISRDYLRTALVLLKHNPSLIKKYFDKIVELALKSHNLNSVLEIIELQNYKNEEFNTFRKICQNTQSSSVVRDHGNLRVNGEFTALHLACMYGQLEVVKRLVNAKASTIKLDKFKNTSLHYSVMQGSVEIVSILVKHIPDRYPTGAKYFKLKTGFSMRSPKKESINIANCLGMTPLHIASMKGNHDIIYILLQNGANIDFPDGTGNTSLHIATLYRQTSALRLLLENGADVNAKNTNNETAMHYASQAGSVDITNVLLAQEIDVNIKNSKGNTALHNAVFYERTNIIKLLIQKGADTDIRNNSDNTVLHTAVTAGKSELVKILLQSGMDINSIGHKGRTPLQVAAYNGHTDIFRILIDNGADIHIRDKYDDTVLHCAVQTGNSDILRIILQRKTDIHLKNRDGESLLHIAINFGHTDIFKLLLENGADVNIRNAKNDSVFDLARIKDRKDILRILSKSTMDTNLKDCNSSPSSHNTISSAEIHDVEKLVLKKEADIFLTNTAENTILSETSEISKAKIIPRLLNEYIDVNVRNKNDDDILGVLVEKAINIDSNRNNKNSTVLHLAVIQENINMIKLLLKKGLDVNLRDCNGNTSLCIAACNGHAKILETLLKNGADFTVRNNDNDTALHLAAQNGNNNIVRILLEKGMDVNSIGSNGNTSVCLAACRGHTDTLGILIENGGNPSIRNVYNDVAIHLAARNGRTGAVEILLQKGINVNVKGCNENTSLHLAADNGQLGTLKTLLQKQADLGIRNNCDNTALHLASLNGETDIVEVLIKNGMDVNLRGWNGNTPLCMAADKGQTHTFRILLQAHANFNIRNDYSKTALHLASQSGKTDIVEILLKKGMDVNLRDSNGNTALCLAACEGEANTVRALLEYEADVCIKNDNNDTALHLAAQRGKADIVEIILNEGVDINLRGCNGNTPLCWAAYKGQTETLVTLLQNGADCSITNDEHNTVLHIAALNGKTNVVKALLEKGMDVNSQDANGNTSLCLAARKGEVDTLRTLLESGADISIKNDDNNTVLHIAAQYGKTDIVKLLLEKGVDVDLRGCDRNTSLSMAACNGHTDILNTLLHHGAKTNIRNDLNYTVLHLAVQHEKTEIVEILLKNGIDVNFVDYDGNTSLCLAAYNGQTEILKTLLQNGADINIANVNNDTALHLAAESGNTEIVEILLRAGCDANSRGCNGNTSLCWAAIEGQIETLEVLLLNGADINAKNNDENTALHLAASSGRSDIVVALLQKGVDINLKGYDGNTSLSLAAYNGQADTLVTLLQNGADVNIKNDSNYTAFDLATQYEKTEIAEILLQRSVDLNLRTTSCDTAMNSTTHNGQSGNSGTQLQVGADTDANNVSNDTPLHLAAQYGETNIVKILLKTGLDVNSRGKDGNTPLCWAACKGQTETLKELLQNGADISIRNEYNNTVLHLAALNGKTDIVEILIRMALDVNSKGYNGNTSLCLAAYSGQTETLEMLLQNGADTNIRNGDNDTALHLAALEGRSEIVDILLKSGMDINLKGGNGDTPLCVAASNGRVETLEMLLQNGADSIIRNNDNDNALNLAIKNGKTDIVEVLLKM